MTKTLTNQEFKAKIKRMLKAQKRALRWIQKQANIKKYKQTQQRHSDIKRKSLGAVRNPPPSLLKKAPGPILVKKK